MMITVVCVCRLGEEYVSGCGCGCVGLVGVDVWVWWVWMCGFGGCLGELGKRGVFCCDNLYYGFLKNIFLSSVFV